MAWERVACTTRTLGTPASEAANWPLQGSMKMGREIYGCG